MDRSSNSDNFKTAIFADCLANSREIFQLIGDLFPVESCRHYGILPLKLAGSNLTVGMLNPHDEESLKFVNSVARVFHYSLEIQYLDRPTLQIMLDSYPQATQTRQRQTDRDRTVIDRDFNPDNLDLPNNEQIARRRKLADSAPTIISQSEELPQPRQPRSASNGNLSELPPDLDFLKDLDLSPSPLESKGNLADSAATLYEIPAEFRNRQGSKNLDDKPTIIAGNPAELLARDLDGISEKGLDAAERLRSQLIAETKGSILEPAKTEQKEDYLSELMPELSWQKLLERVFEHRTDYIYFKFAENCGTIVTDRNGSVQSMVEEVPLPIFCSTIDEIKRMARIPQNTLSHPKKVVLEKFHQQERILLRIEFVSQKQLEVNVQVLRDRALRIYEQQQMDKASEQALQLAKQLEKTLKRLQSCYSSARLANLSELQTVHHNIEHQLKMLDK